MRLLSLRLYNYRQYKDATIIFPIQGLIGILGKNGAGKSTLFTSIGAMFYGTGKLKDITKDDIKNVNAGKRERCFVEGHFLFNNELLHMKRDFFRTNDCFIKKADGTVLALGASNMTAYIESTLLKMDGDAFSACYYAEQDDFDNLVKLTPTKRVKTITELLRIEVIDAAAKKTRSDRDLLEAEIKQAKAFLSEDANREAEIAEFKKQIGEIWKAIEATDKEIEAFQQLFLSLLAQKELGDKNYQTHLRLSSERDMANTKMESLTAHSLVPDKTKLAELQKAKTRLAEIAKYKGAFDHLWNQKEALSADRATYKEKLDLEAELKKLKTEVESYSADYAEAKKELASRVGIDELASEKETALETLQNEISALRDQRQEKHFAVKEKTNEMEKLKAARDSIVNLGPDSPCPTCNQPLGTHFEEEMRRINAEAQSVGAEAKRLAEERAKVEDLGKQKTALLPQAKEELADAKLKQNAKNAAVEKIKHLEKELLYRKNNYGELIAKYEKVKHVAFDEQKYQDVASKLEKASKIRDEILSLEPKVKEIPTLEAKISSAENEVKSLQGALQTAQTALAELGFDESAFQTMQKRIDEAKSQKFEKESHKTRFGYEITSIENEIKRVDELLKQSKKRAKEIATKEKEAALLGKLNEVYRAYKLDILSKLAPALSQIMSEDIEIMTNGAYNQVELDDEYNIYIYRQGEKKSLNFFSGGEKKLAALCQRLAISELLVSQTGQASFDMLALDEVLGSLDTERQDSVVEMLRNLNEKFDQIMMITHGDTVREQFDCVLEITTDADRNSVARWSNEWDFSETEHLLEMFEDYDGSSESEEEAI